MCYSNVAVFEFPRLFLANPWLKRKGLGSESGQFKPEVNELVFSKAEHW